MLLRHVHWYSDGKDGSGDIRIFGGAIEEIGKGLAPRIREESIELRDCLALPGLINPHDHLDFNLLPIPGNPPYSNLTAYAADIYRPNQSPLREMLSIPIRDRLLWGGYKTLISGVTTVCHHNPPDPVLGTGFPVRVARGVAWSHSLYYSQDPLNDFRKAAGRPFVIHAAEGVDEAARLEIEELDNLGILQNNTVIVHGVALGEEEIARLERAGTALIWCPVSNLSLFQQTAPVAQLRGRVPITLGSDSLLTGSVTFFDEIRAARDTGLVTVDELLSMVTTTASQILKLPAGRGTLRAGIDADLIVLPDTGMTPAETLLRSRAADLELVLAGGQVRLAGRKLGDFEINAVVDGEAKFIRGALARLNSRISNRLGKNDGGIRASPLWQMIQSGKERVH